MREGAPPLAEAIDLFLDDVGIALSPLTRTTYATRLRPLRSLDWPLDCRALIRAELDIHARSTVRNFCGVLSVFCKFCVAQGWLTENPMQGVPFPKAPTRPHRYLPKPALEALWAVSERFDARTHRGPHGVSFRLLLALLSVGLRVSEACSVRVEDIDDGLLLVRGKGSKYRYVPLPRSAVPLLPESGVILPVKPRRVQHMIDQLAAEAGIGKIHPHLLRHSFASNALLDGAGLGELQAVLGHADQRMTQFYARSVLQKSAAKAMARFTDG